MKRLLSLTVPLFAAPYKRFVGDNRGKLPQRDIVFSRPPQVHAQRRANTVRMLAKRMSGRTRSRDRFK